MAGSSKARKVKPKGTVRELKIVQSISRQGVDTFKTEEVGMPRRDIKNASSSRRSNQSSSPAKRPKQDGFDAEPLPCHFEGPDDDGKRETLVCILPWLSPPFSDSVKGQHDFLAQFLGHETSYLHHLLNLELPPTDVTCSACGQVEGHFRCLDCYGPHWWCQACLIKGHRHHPFHRPQQWTEGSFEKCVIVGLGLRFCPWPFRLRSWMPR
jgi:hypothetical protein